MKTEDKVVSRAMAKSLAQAGWKDYTTWTWMKLTEDWELIPTYDVEDLVLRRRAHRLSYTHYPAPDVSELLEALRQEDGVLELTIDPDSVGAQLSSGSGEWPYQRAGGETPQQALARLWVAVKVGGQVNDA